METGGRSGEAVDKDHGYECKAFLCIEEVKSSGMRPCPEREAANPEATNLHRERQKSIAKRSCYYGYKQ